MSHYKRFGEMDTTPPQPKASPHIKEFLQHFYFLSDGRGYTEAGPQRISLEWAERYLRSLAGYTNKKLLMYTLKLLQVADTHYISKVLTR